MAAAARVAIPIRKGTKRVRFSKRTLEALKPPGTGRAYWYDTATPSLTLCITASDHRAFYSYRKIDGKPVRVKLGEFPDISVEQARKLCGATSTAISEGRNPVKEKRERREELTLGELWDWYFEKHSKVHCKSWKHEEGLWRRYLASWKSRRLTDISQDDVASLHSRLGDRRGKTSANRAVELLCNMFNVAINRKKWKRDNPASGIRRFKLVQRERFLQPHEVQPLLKAADDDQNPDMGDFVRLALFTGARRWNLLSMKWADIDLKSAVWNIPETKNGKPVHIPLAGPAIEILTKRRAAAKPDAEFVFPSRIKNGKYPHLFYQASAWWRITKRAGLSDLRLHDLRRSLASWQAAAGANAFVLMKSLGHSSLASTAIYARLNLDPVRESVGNAVAALVAAGEKGGE